MSDVREAAEALLEEQPHLESRLEDIVETDAEGSWEFDDVTVDSGEFGEIVSRGIVEERQDGYRVVDREAVRAALGDRSAEETDTGGREWTLPAIELPSVSRRVWGAVLGGLVLVALTRIVFVYPDVFRNGHVVLAGNDPWGYRYWVETLLTADLSALDLGSLPEYLGPGLSQDTLYVVVAWWAASLLGGTPTAAGVALAWLPVLSAVVTALLVYLIAVRVTADRRIGLASIVLLAFTPVHAYRTGLGFGDHHAFDYVWVTLTLYALVLLATRRESQSIDREIGGVSIPGSAAGWTGAVLLGVGISAQSLAWRAGPLLALPVAGYAIYRAVSDVRVDSSPLAGNVALLAGIALASVLTVLPATVWGWEISWIRTVAPTLLLGGVLATLVVGEIGHRLSLSPRTVVGGSVVGGIGVFVSIWVTVPQLSTTITSFFAYLERTGQSSIAETASLFSGNLGSIVAPMLFLGFILYLALPYAAIAAWRAYRSHQPEWAVLAIYVGYFLVLSIVQLRFAGQLSIPTAVFAGIGFVHLASVVDLIERPGVFGTDGSDARSNIGDIRSFAIPSRETATYLVVLFLLVASISFVQIPIKQEQLTVEEDTYQTASWISSYAHEDGVAEGYVFSQWGRNRVYNYFLDGDSASYEFAQDYYANFTVSEDGSEWYHRLTQKSSSTYVVTQPTGISDPDSLQRRIHRQYGSATDESAGLAHYRTIYIGDSRTVTTLVPGATIVGVAEPGESISLSTSVQIGTSTVTYERHVQTNPYGIYAVTVAYPGTYHIQGADTSVSKRAVTQGERYVRHNRSGIAHWPFDKTNSAVAYDRVGGYRGTIDGASVVSRAGGQALSFDGRNDTVKIENRLELEGSLTISFWIRGNLGAANETYPTVFSYHSRGNVIGFWARSDNDFGFAVDDVNNSRVRNFGIKRTSFDQWTHVTGVIDRTKGESRLYMNGELVSVSDLSSLNELAESGELTIGSRAGSNAAAPVHIDEVRIFDTAMNGIEIERISS